ncbi:hypothetical protein [Methylobacterium mesophilicum]
MTETYAQSQARIRRERKARTEAARASIAAYWAGSATASVMSDYASGRVVTVSLVDGVRTVTNGPGV